MVTGLKLQTRDISKYMHPCIEYAYVATGVSRVSPPPFYVNVNGCAELTE